MGGGEKRKEKIKKIKKERGTETEGERDKDSLYLEISPFVHFMVKILFHKSNDI